MTEQRIRIATRRSPLALWQAYHVRDSLTALYPNIKIEIIEMVSTGDKILDRPLAKIGGKGLFVKELEEGLMANTADIAVHSMKDVPFELPEGLCLPVIMQREEPADAFVSNHFKTLEELPQGATLGTSSLRRQCQILALRPDLKIKSLRGNVGTRLQKLDDGEFDAIILAGAGLKRLELESRIQFLFASEAMLPAIGQGAIGIECRTDDQATQDIINSLNDDDTQARVMAERAMNRCLGGSCQTPIAGFATLEADQQLYLRGIVGSEDGNTLLRSESRGSINNAETLGESVAADLLKQGAMGLLKLDN
jgi:hydroxymethylbilane synthase